MASRPCQEALQFTHNDRFPKLPGYKTFTSHYHMAIAINAMKEKASGSIDPTPDYVRMFKEMNVNMVHLAEFHGDGHPQDPGPLRLPKCRPCSTNAAAVGRQAAAHARRRSQRPSRFLSPASIRATGCISFPKPVYWTMVRGADQPFVEESPLRQGLSRRRPRRHDPAAQAEEGLAWTAHPRSRPRAGRPTSSATRTFSSPTTGSAARGRRCPPTSRAKGSASAC